ncbi:hypothetical protein QJS04_geneDACA005409 [Acorus gramineus]|uniref:Uncharacterized protein n=1 Tax=Acorus gramineus TaxID=55184 RepID=A0AAV9A4K5_ACOGR|nr:hypothetical protein QJS04_geneDACA005409 [Acorus gramineus]
MKARLHPYVPSDPSNPVASLIKDGSWVKPTWWSTNWEDSWKDVIEQDCGGIGEDSLIWPISHSRTLRAPSAWSFLRQKRDKPKCIFLGINLKEEPTDHVKNLASQWAITILPIEHSSTKVSWQPPSEGWFKSNSHGSLTEDRAGYGAIIRNGDGDTIYAVAVQDKHLFSINILEYKAVLEGL